MFESDLSSRKPSTFLDRRLTALSLTRRGADASDDFRGPLGLTLLYTPAEPQIEFIFVHGLRGGSRKTWSKSENIRHFWPQEWLPEEPRFKHVRIHSFGYQSDWRESKGCALNIHDFGQALLGEIQNSPHICASGVSTPIVLIGHSMGGIVVKKAFLLARQDPNYRALVNRFHSMFFLATPHRGADSAQLLGNLLRLSVSHTSKSYVGDLIPESGVTQVINDEFRHFYARLQLWSFFETVETSLGLIVPKDSAVLGVPGERVQLLNADHRNVCKFEDRSDNNYLTLRNAFVSTIDSIEKTWLSSQKEEHRSQMRLLSQYLAISENPEADLASVVEKKAEGSCEWLTKSASFMEWREGSDVTAKYFWLSAEPATGKSTIAGHIIKYLQDCNSECMYFFFQDGDLEKSNTAMMLRSLAWQMASINTDIRQVLLEMEHDGEHIDKVDSRAIWRTLFATRILQVELRQPCFWVLDGLDECSNHNVLFPLLAKVEQDVPLRVFLTSRPSPTIERLFSQENIPHFTKSISREESQSDIKLFLEANSRYFPVDDELERDALVEQVLDKSNGNFLWASLVLKELEATHTKQQIHNVLRSVPREMDGLYTRILHNLIENPGNKDLARAVLKWTVCAARPLTVEELKDAVSLDIGETPSRLEKIAGPLCGHLVYVDRNLRVQIAHQTVRSFLFTQKNVPELAFERQKEHTRISEVCLKYLGSEEMRTVRYRRGSASARIVQRSAFAEYATVYFAGHLVRSTSSNDNQLVALDSFLQTNSLTWIELIARSGDLNPITQAAKSLKTYLERRAKYCSPLGSEVQNTSAWARDLVQLVARFGKALLTCPSAIHFLIPPVCPPESIIAKTFSAYPRALQMTGGSRKDWDDQLCCVASVDAQALSIACRDNRFAIGGSDGIVRIYHATTFQEERTLVHKEPVRNLEFGSINTFLASAGRTNLNIWNSSSGLLLITIKMRDQIMALDFTMDNSMIMVATKTNTLSFWRVEDGMEMDKLQFSDIEEDQEEISRFPRQPTHIAFSTELNLLAVTYRQRPVSIWDLEDGTYVGQFHKSVEIYPGPLIFALIFNSNPGLSLAAVAYDDGDLVTFDPITQQKQASTSAWAATLASSPDGTILATGDGEGVITLYEFETLGMLYRLHSFQYSIRSVVFNSNNSRFLDIRSSYCNVWEPSILVRRQDFEETSSVDVSEHIQPGPQFGSTRSFDDDRVITAMTAHHNGGAIFCGREDGTVVVYSIATGEPIKELYSHAKNVAVLLISWSQTDALLASIDRSGRFMVRSVITTDSQDVIMGELIIDKKSPGAATQLLFSTQGKRLLVSMSQTIQLWDLENATLVCTHSVDTDTTPGRWVSHPSDSAELLLFQKIHVRRYNWDTLTELSHPDSVSLDFDTTSSELFPSVTNDVSCVTLVGSRTENVAATLHIMPTTNLRNDTETVEHILTYDKLAQTVKRVVGYYKSSLVFLTHDGWICSLIINNRSRKQAHYTRHFFIPFRFHSMNNDVMMLVAAKGSIIITDGDELLIFHNGLDFELEVELEQRTTSSRPLARLGMRRTSSGRTTTSRSSSRTMVSSRSSSLGRLASAKNNFDK